ncbi:hypothetical protein EFN19_05440 [Propionibacterium freudenreichii]|nr:hypothetical protein [Propionibacterium freudenreichii]
MRDEPSNLDKDGDGVACE